MTGHRDHWRDGILTLDIARLTGWAVIGKPGIAAWTTRGGFIDRSRTPRPPVLCGTHAVAGQGTALGPYFAAFEAWLITMLDTHAPKAVVFEGPLVNRAGGKGARSANGILQVRRAVGCCSTVDKECSRRGIETREVNLMTIKKVFAGNGRAEKFEMMAAARARGWNHPDDNAADACGILECSVRALKFGEVL